MGFSSIAIEQREKELKALKSFLTFSTIASLAFHAAVIASGIGNILGRTPDLEAEPIELTLVEPEVKETPLKQEEKKPEKPEKLTLGRTTEVLTSSTTNSGESALTPEPPKPVPINPVIPQQVVPEPVERPIQKQVTEKPSTPTKVEQPSTPIQRIPTQRLPENIQTQATNRVEKQDPVVPQTAQTQTNTTATNTTSQTPTTNTTNDNTASSGSLRSTLGQIRDARASQTTTGSGGDSSTSGNPLGGGNSTVAFSTTPGSGTDRGNRTERGERRKREITAAPTQPNLTTETEKPDRSGSPEGSADGRAACRDCKVRYSERARKRRAEGRVEVAVDTDSQGNVTNVRVLNSSGDRDLDEEHVRQAREWKLKPSETGRQGVRIGTEYSIEGSRRNRQVRERQRQREERERQQQVVSANSINNNSSSSQENPRRRRRLEASIGNSDVPTTSRRRRSFDTSNSTETANTEASRSSRLSRRLRRQTSVAASNSEDSTPRRVRRSEESSIGTRLRRRSLERRREVTADVRTSGTQPTRRRRRSFNQPSQGSDSSSRLRNALRRSRESAPAAVPSNEGSND